METSESKLVTPIYLKAADRMSWPEDDVFYLLSGNGLFICRDDRFFRSSVPARGWPAELSNQDTFIEPRYPKIAKPLLERIVGFFARVGEDFGAEAAVLLVWDRDERQVRLMIPKQRCTMFKSWNGMAYPVGVHYELPTRLPDNWLIFGDIHSHVDGAAFSSFTDKYDENFRPGLHIVVGRIYQEPPEFHIEAVVDGMRFRLDKSVVFDDYAQRCPQVPSKWFDKITVEFPPVIPAGFKNGGG